MDVIEIGIDQGESLKMWPWYFPNARIIGVDIHEICKKHETDRVIVETGSSSDPDMLAKLTRIYRPKIIIDDGSHLASDNLAALNAP